ncbi:proline-rich receptor-like protein kinase PERK12 [Iris pallida]|uniref:Proline-rich receptor-like protein kinase PERK12 n=1 Tax=Iris pallida TaxID=29817 RepID=A0AAX6GDY2_IRIPA|nr:proline-rich receptor-like protein kinase PERK12 [Iris pallida]
MGKRHLSLSHHLNVISLFLSPFYSYHLHKTIPTLSNQHSSFNNTPMQPDFFSSSTPKLPRPPIDSSPPPYSSFSISSFILPPPSLQATTTNIRDHHHLTRPSPPP